MNLRLTLSDDERDAICGIFGYKAGEKTKEDFVEDFFYQQIDELSKAKITAEETEAMKTRVKNRMDGRPDRVRIGK